jgi:hypothetical protein
MVAFKSAEKPDNLYGDDVYAVVIDEASRVRQESWHAVRSTLTATRGPVRIIGNIKGRKNWFYDLARKAEAGEEGMHYALGKSLVDALYGLILAANYSNNTVQAQSGFDRSTLITLAQALTLRGVPTMGRTVLLNVPYFGQLSLDPTLVQMAAFQDRSLIAEYKLPPVAGFQPVEAPNLPSTNSLAGFAFTPDALVLATRVPNDYSTIFPGATGGGVVSVVVNPDTGMAVQQVQYVNHATAVSAMRVALMFGVAVGQAAGGQRLVSA